MPAAAGCTWRGTDAASRRLPSCAAGASDFSIQRHPLSPPALCTPRERTRCWAHLETYMARAAPFLFCFVFIFICCKIARTSMCRRNRSTPAPDNLFNPWNSVALSSLANFTNCNNNLVTATYIFCYKITLSKQPKRLHISHISCLCCSLPACAAAAAAA